VVAKSARKALLEKYMFPSRMEIRSYCIYECCSVNIILFLGGNGNPVGKKFIPGL